MKQEKYDFSKSIKPKKKYKTKEQMKEQIEEMSEIEFDDLDYE